MIKPMAFATKTERPTDRLNILCSARVRLTDEQRKILKTAFYKIRDSITPDSLPQIGGSTVRTETIFNVNSGLPLSDIVIIDLLSTRDTITLTTVLSLQAALGVEAITQEDVMNAFKGYCDYVFKIGTENE